MGRDLAAEYDKRYPDVEIPAAQKEERMERLLFKEERVTYKRANRNRGVVFTRLPLDEHGRLRP